MVATKADGSSISLSAKSSQQSSNCLRISLNVSVRLTYSAITLCLQLVTIKDIAMALTKQQQQIRCQIVLDDLLMVEFDDFMYGLDKKNGLMPSHEYNTKVK